MQNKLQELTDKLYNEGLSKGKQEGEAVLANARVQAAEIVENAKKEAAGIVAAARKEAENIRSKADGDLRIAAGQSIEATRQAIETPRDSEERDRAFHQKRTCINAERRAQCDLLKEDFRRIHHQPERQRLLHQFHRRNFQFPDF